MDFFEHQEKARHKTHLLVVYFILAVALIVLAVYAIFALIFIMQAPVDQAPSTTALQRLWNSGLFLWVSGITLAIVAVGTLYKIVALSGGGEAVAISLGARSIQSSTTDPAERRLLNVVEEMALAAGIPPPRVFLLENEDSINAFAAGFSTQDAIIGVTRGCIQRLTRDELQGVIAHEFSHIFNGDMRLNIRLMGILNGILVIAIIGYWILRMAAQSSGSSRKKGGGAVLAMLLLGLGVMLIGYIGVFFGKLIKSAVSRQREFLADAAAVQFTRNPPGIAGALKKIGGWVSGSRLTHPNAEQASHLFFANGLAGSFLNLLATHPPLAERIRRIDPAFDGVFAPLIATGPTAAETRTDQAQPTADRLTAYLTQAGAGAGGKPLAVRTTNLVQSIGNPQREHLAYATTLLACIPDKIKIKAREPSGARAVIFSLLLAADDAVRQKQLEHLAGHTPPEVYRETCAGMSDMQNLRPEMRLPLAEMALMSLHSLSKQQYEDFKTTLRYLVEADDCITLFEYALQRMLVRRLAAAFDGATKHAIEYYDLRPLMRDAAVLLSTLAYYGRNDTEGATAAFARGAAQLARGGSIAILERAQCGLQPADHALAKLNGASPPIKKMLLNACLECVAADGRITLAEAELIRAIADALDCPIPPIIPDLAA